jgi:uncharacterized lipoprotein NlpE involved in copper resistance
MKKIFTIAAVISAAFFLTGCGKRDEEKAQRIPFNKFETYLVTEIEGCKIYYIDFRHGVYFAKCNDKISSIDTFYNRQTGKTSTKERQSLVMDH